MSHNKGSIATSSDGSGSPKGAERKSRRLERPELYSFLLFASTMVLYGAIFLTQYYLLFAGFAILDGYLTFYRMDALISIERVFFGFLAILLTAIVANFGILPLMIEGVLVIALLDFASLLRRARYTDELTRIAGGRLRSYLSSLLPATALSFAMVYLYSSLALVPKEPMLPLALATAGIFVVILVVARLIFTNKDDAIDHIARS